MRPPDRSPLYVLAILALLIVPQVRAIALQFAGGYRPFVHAPTRVPLSWDMFSVPITRCDVRWTPGLVIGGSRIDRMSDTGARLEWDPVYDRAVDYQAAARFACRYATEPTTASVRCFEGDGTDTTYDVRCQ